MIRWFRTYRACRRARNERRLRDILAHGGQWRSYELRRAARVGIGAMYVILDRWEDDGTVESGWGEASMPGGPRPRWYHPGYLCAENERGQCLDRFGGTPAEGWLGRRRPVREDTRW